MPKTLITRGTILSLDPAIGDLPRGDVLIEDDRIVAVAPEISAEDATVLDAAGTIVMPGLINAHIHTWETGLRGLGADWAGSDYYNFFHATVAPRFTPGDTFIHTLLGALSQMDAGSTTIFDWCHNNTTPAHSDAAVEALFDSGIRAVFGHGTVKPKPKPGQAHFSEVPHPVEEIRRLRTGRLSSDEALVSLAICILGPDYSTLEVCRQDFRAAREFGLLSSAHVWGRANRLVKGGYKVIAEEGLLGPDHNIVHGNYIEGEELRIIVESGASVTSTTGVELRNHVREPLSGPVRRLGGKPSIGIDSEVGGSGGMLAAMRFALAAHRRFDNEAVVRRIQTEPDSPEARYVQENLKTIGTGGSMIQKVSIPTREVLEWATINNARALRLDHRIGSLTPGKQADLILIRRDSLNMLSAQDPAQAVVHYAEAADVDTVIVGGRLVKRGGRLTYGSLERRKAELLASTERLIRTGAAAA